MNLDRLDHRKARIAIVGGSLGGLRAAEQLRRQEHTGPITVYGAEPFAAYNRPPLSKAMLSHEDRPAAPEMHAQLAFRPRGVDDVEFRHGVTVTSADLEVRTLAWEDHTGATGDDEYDGLVIATGLRSRRLNIPGPATGRYALRTIEDLIALREALIPGASVVVIGAGFIGTEVACTLVGMGHRVTVVEPIGPPMSRVLGTELSEAVKRHLEAGGIEFVIGPSIQAYAGDETVAGVVLTDGSTLPADLVLESVGSVCNIEWLADNDLDLSDGVLVDNRLAVVGLPNAVAVGDIARFPNPLFDDVPRRVEHWSMPTDTAKQAAATLAAQMRGDEPDPAPWAPIPSFWSDQLDLRFQSFGAPQLGDDIRIEGDLDDLTSGVVATYHRSNFGEDQHLGTVALNVPGARQRDLRAAFVGRAN
jgi:3-phenylpropionate/trans-cinnamate dioxygenase ferredoxin reductase component